MQKYNQTKDFSKLPQGLAAAFSQNAAAVTVFANLSEKERQKVLDAAFHATSKKEMIDLVQSITVRTFPE